MRYVIAVLLVLGLCSFALADQTSEANWNNDLGRFGDRLRDATSGHSHAYDLPDLDRNIEYGAGVDLIVFEKDTAEPTGNKPVKFIKKYFTPDVITSENRVDFGNQEYKTYLVATYRLNDLWKKKAE